MSQKENGYFQKKWRTSQTLVYGLIGLISITLIVSAVSLQNIISPSNYQLIISLGIAFGPASILSFLYRLFLLGDVKDDLLLPIGKLENAQKELFREFSLLQQETSDKIEKVMVENVEESLNSSVKPILKKIDLLNELDALGVINVYTSRAEALRQDSTFFKELEREEDEISIIGSSLRGLLQERVFEEVKKLLFSKKDILNILLTHPCIADLRAYQENRNPGDIPREIISTIKILKDKKFPLEKIHFYKGAPTCFTIKTRNRMILNPYPYTKQSMDSPCFELIGQRTIYTEFDQAHFHSFNTTSSENYKDRDYDWVIRHFEDNNRKYSQKAQCVLEKIEPNACSLKE